MGFLNCASLLIAFSLAPYAWASSDGGNGKAAPGKDIRDFVIDLTTAITHRDEKALIVMAPAYADFSPALKSYLFESSGKISLETGEMAISVWEVFEVGHSIQTGVAVQSIGSSKDCDQILRLHFYADNDRSEVEFPLPVSREWADRYFSDYIFTDVCQRSGKLSLHSLFGYNSAEEINSSPAEN